MCSQRGFFILAQASHVELFSILTLLQKAASFQLHGQSQYNNSPLPSPLIRLACARRGRTQPFGVAGAQYINL